MQGELVRVWAGTSGYSYQEWKGSFYPDKLPAARMLAYYAERFSSVEINNTFYRIPARSVFTRWLDEVPSGFRFALKAPRRITHQLRLQGAEHDLAYFFDVAAVLGDRLGPLLFQLPPFLKKDVSRLRDFLHLLPPQRRTAFEFRNPSWFDDEVYAALHAHDVALCVADTDEGTSALVASASWGYLRLRRAEYSDGELAAWAQRIADQPWSEAFAYFKHEDEARGPRFAQRFSECLDSFARN